MSSQSALEVEGLAKHYRIAAAAERATNIPERIAHLVRHPLQRTKHNIFEALSDVNLVVNHGEAVGVIGRNGAGKSTLLKILSRITSPTAGTVRLYGNVGSLLEVGTGFHPELTGRENVFLNGTILGMSRKAIRSKFDSIVEFSEVGKFLDTPVKRYSSGMYVRLAFAVAAHLEPDILIVDEVLAVGDVQFQQKCLGKMGEVSSSDGRAVLFVSHNMNAIQTLCTRSVLLEGGTIAFDGATSDGIDRYLQRASMSHEIAVGHYDLAAASGSGRDAQLRSLRTLALSGQPLRSIAMGEGLRIELGVRDFAPTRQTIDVRIRTDAGVLVSGVHSSLRRLELLSDDQASDHVAIEFPSLPIQPGHYFIEVSLRESGMREHEIESIDRAAPLDIVASNFYGSGWTTKRGIRYGITALDPDWRFFRHDELIARSTR